MKKAFLTNTGRCCTALADFDLIKSFLEKNGWELSSRIRDAKVIIIYACACTKEREDLSAESIKKALKEKNSEAQIIVTGCLPVINQGRLKKIFKGDALSADSLEGLDKLLNSKSSIRGIKCVGLPGKKGSQKKDAYNLRIGWGCQGKCSYCAIRFVFGKPRSRPISKIVQEFDSAYSNGYRKFILAANDLGYYGEDLDISLVDLLQKLFQRNKESQFMLSGGSIHKLKKMLPSLRVFFHTGRIWRVNLPLESGSNKILGLMKRAYKTEDSKYCVKKLKEYAPNLEMRANIIPGFPGETEKDFQDTLEFVYWLSRYVTDFSFIPYSSRPHTPASKMAGQIKPAVIKNRLKRLNNLYRFTGLNKGSLVKKNKNTGLSYE